MSPQTFENFNRDLQKAGFVGDIRVKNPMHGGCILWDGPARIDEPAFAIDHRPLVKENKSDLDDPVLLRISSGGLGVDRHPRNFTNVRARVPIAG